MVESSFKWMEMVFQTFSEPFFIVFDLEESSHWNRQNWSFRVPGVSNLQSGASKRGNENLFSNPQKWWGVSSIILFGRFFHPRNGPPRCNNRIPSRVGVVQNHLSAWLTWHDHDDHRGNFFQANLCPMAMIQKFCKSVSSWWFQPIWKMLAKLDHFAR